MEKREDYKVLEEGILEAVTRELLHKAVSKCLLDEMIANKVCKKMIY